VEFALILPLVLLLLLGLIWFGRAFTIWIDQTHLANEGARYAVVNGTPTPGEMLDTTILNEMSSQLDNKEVKFCSTGAQGDPMTVSVSGDYTWGGGLSGLFGFFGLPTSWPIKATSTMRFERTDGIKQTNYQNPVIACP
jgi:Flp pilus assembly protein TadG